MNAIMLVFFFLLLITFSTSALFDHLLATSRIKHSYEAYLNTIHEMRDKNTSSYYRSHIKRKKSVAKKKKPRDLNTYTSFREKITDNGKLNIYAMLDKDHQILQETTANLIIALYKDSTLFQEAALNHSELHQAITDALIQAARSVDKKLWELEKLSFEDNELAMIWYQMLKGSPAPDEEGGHPALTDYIVIDKNRRAVSVQNASIPVLQSFFGEKVTKKILEKEKEHYKEGKRATILQNELKQMITDSKFIPHKKHFQMKPNKKEETTIEKLRSEKTQITASLLAPTSYELPEEEEVEKDET